MTTFAIYYADGSVLTSDDCELYDIPALGVIAIAQPDLDLGRHVVSGFDFYFMRDEWFGSDQFGLFQYLLEPGPKKVIFGQTIANQAFREILLRACDDATMARKSAFARNERKP